MCSQPAPTGHSGRSPPPGEGSSKERTHRVLTVRWGPGPDNSGHADRWTVVADRHVARLKFLSVLHKTLAAVVGHQRSCARSLRITICSQATGSSGSRGCRLRGSTRAPRGRHEMPPIRLTPLQFATPARGGGGRLANAAMGMDPGIGIPMGAWAACTLRAEPADASWSIGGRSAGGQNRPTSFPFLPLPPQGMGSPFVPRSGPPTQARCLLSQLPSKRRNVVESPPEWTSGPHLN